MEPVSATDKTNENKCNKCYWCMPDKCICNEKLEGTNFVGPIAYFVGQNNQEKLIEILKLIVKSDKCDEKEQEILNQLNSFGCINNTQTTLFMYMFEKFENNMELKNLMDLAIGTTKILKITKDLKLETEVEPPKVGGGEVNTLNSLFSSNPVSNLYNKYTQPNKTISLSFLADTETDAKPQKGGNKKVISLSFLQETEEKQKGGNKNMISLSFLKDTEEQKGGNKNVISLSFLKDSTTQEGGGLNMNTSSSLNEFNTLNQIIDNLKTPMEGGKKSKTVKGMRKLYTHTEGGDSDNDATLSALMKTKKDQLFEMFQNKILKMLEQKLITYKNKPVDANEENARLIKAFLYHKLRENKTLNSSDKITILNKKTEQEILDDLKDMPKLEDIKKQIEEHKKKKNVDSDDITIEDKKSKEKKKSKKSKENKKDKKDKKKSPTDEE